MRKTIWAGMLAAAAFAVAGEARADANLHSADVLRPGDNMLYGEVGWPELALGFQHGLSEKLDIGFRFSFIYGWEYRVCNGCTIPGLGMRVPIRFTPVKTGKVSFQIHFDPGLKFDDFGASNCVGVNNRGCVAFNNGSLAFGLWLAFGLDVGIHLTREATLSFGLDAPFYVNFTNGVYGGIPLLFGPGFEYDINDNIALGINLRLGPSIYAYSQTAGNGTTYSYNDTQVGLIALPFFAYKL